MSRTVVVVGGSSGIGLATARAFRDAGDTVHAAARRDIDEPGVSAHRLDFTEPDAVAAFAAGFDRVDALIISAGTNLKERRLHELTPESWRYMVDANLNGPFYVLRAFLDALRAARGSVIIISSVSGAYTDRSGPAYQAAKGGAIKLSHAAGFETGGEVRCTVILPGVVDTDILDNRPEPPTREQRDQMLHAEDIAAACVFAVSLPPRAFIPELTILPTALQAIGKTL
jgi:NAD(P)-dependent dehydrogenase (short-subunit alcohol dehydrogenase family)